MSETSDLNTKLSALDPGAINEEMISPQLMTCAGEHYFMRQYGNEAKCAKCPLGYYLSLGMTVKEGHIMNHGELVI